MWPNDVTRKDLRIEYYRGSGPGGQNKNKRDTACRITHIPTGIVATAQDERKQDRNRKLAFRRLSKKLIPLMTPKIEVEKSTERVRSYNKVRGKVKDHRVPDKTYDFDSVLNGDLDEIINDVLGA
jgi:peptide chain release factor 1